MDSLGPAQPDPRSNSLIVENTARGTVLATRCTVADSLWSRGIGLLGRGGLAEGEGLLITRTSAITMLFMRFAIDAVFIDRASRVIRVTERLRPWVPIAFALGADAVLELPSGTADRTGTQAGDVLRISMTPAAAGTPHEGAPPPHTPG